MSGIEWFRWDDRYSQAIRRGDRTQISRLAIYYRRKDKQYYIVPRTGPSSFAWNRFSEDMAVGPPWPTRAAAQVALLIKLEAEGW